MLARLIVVVAAVTAIAQLATHLGDARACEHGRSQLFGLAVAGHAPAAGVASTVRTVRGRCADADDLAGAAASLVVAGRAGQGRSLARDAVERAPEQFAGWVSLEAALRGDDPAGARRAEERARALNPRWSGPVQLPARQAARGGGP